MAWEKKKLGLSSQSATMMASTSWCGIDAAACGLGCEVKSNMGPASGALSVKDKVWLWGSH